METLDHRHGRKDPGHLACRVGLFAFSYFLTLSATPTVAAELYGNPAKFVRVPAVATSTAVKQPVAVFVVDVAEKPRRTIVRIAGPYLPMTGALPLRFSSARRWPAPLPTASEPAAGDEAASTVAASDFAPPASPTELPVLPLAQVANTTPASGARKSVAAPGKSSAGPTSLTADMVLGFLGNLPANEGRGGARFEPAIPRAVTTSAAAIASP